MKAIIKKIFIGSLFLLFGTMGMAQGKIIDKVVAVVGNNAIYYSDIENQYMQYLMQGYTADAQTMRCQIFEEVLFAKLLLNQAQIDSIEISDEQVENEIDRRLQYFISQIGSKEKLEEYYNKSIMAIKSDLRNVIHDQMLSEQVKRGITSDIRITPSEVKDYYKSIPKDSIFTVPSEIEYSEIVKIPKVTKEEKAFARAKLEGIRKRIIDGADFASMALIYSEDPGSAAKGGELGDFSRGVMAPEFEAAAFALQGDEISPIIETKYGYHILQLIKRKGDYINVRHILIQTKISPVSLEKTKHLIDSIYQLVAGGELTFEQAAMRFSDDDSKNNGGAVINPATGNRSFNPQQMDKNLFFVLYNMNVGEIKPPMIYERERGVKAFRIVRLDKRTKPHKASLDTDYDLIQEAALAQKKTDAISKWIQDKTKHTFINITDEQLKKCNFEYDWE
jgi:peptidyl-prolyl cis-trans isomerase SurA